MTDNRTRRPNGSAQPKRVNVQISAELAEDVSAAAAERGWSRATFVDRAIVYYMERLVPIDEMQFTRERNHTDDGGTHHYG